MDRRQLLAKKAQVLGIMAVAAATKEKENCGKRIWSKEWLKRKDAGSYEQIFRELQLEDTNDIQTYIRMPLEVFHLILAKITPLIQRQDTQMRMSIPPGARLLATLRFLATGCSYTDLQFSSRISKQSLSIIIPETCKAIYESLKGEYLKTPSTEAEWKNIAQEFQDKWNFPHCIGSLDGKHIQIKPPPNGGSYYFNYKQTHSIILLALVSAQYEFLYADVGTNGRASDAGVWDQSDMKKLINSNSLGIPSPEVMPNSSKCLPFVIVGDDAFPLGVNLMKPFPFRNQTNEEKIFSYRLSRARRTVENAFGILSNKFRIFLAPIDLAPKKVEAIVLAALVMHNLLRRICPDYTAAGAVDQEDFQEGVVIQGAWHREGGLTCLQRQPRNAPNDAKAVRRHFMDFFNNEGKVPWQDAMINTL